MFPMPSSDLIVVDVQVKGVSEPSCFNFGTSGTRRFGICRSSLHLTEGNYLEDRWHSLALCYIGMKVAMMIMMIGLVIEVW